MALAAHRYTGVTQTPGRTRYSYTYGPVLLASTGAWDAAAHVEYLGPGLDGAQPAAWMTPVAGQPLHWGVAGVPGAATGPGEAAVIPAGAAIGAGITPDGAITRYTVTGGLDWTLTRLADQTRMAGGHIDAFTSYSATGSTVAGQTAQSDAYLRLMRLLGDDLLMRLIAASASFAP
jgi:hypothetical protein